MTMELKVEFRVLATMCRTLRKTQLDTSIIYRCWNCIGFKELCENCELFYDDTWNKIAILLTAGA